MFNAAPAAEAYLSHSLVELLKAVSPAFKRTWSELLKRRAARNPLEVQPAPLPHWTSLWLAPTALVAPSAHTSDLFRLADGTFVVSSSGIVGVVVYRIVRWIVRQ